MIKARWQRNKNRHVDQYNTIEYPEVDPHVYDQLIFNKAPKVIQGILEGCGIFSTNGARTIGYPYFKKWTSTLVSHHIQKLT